MEIPQFKRIVLLLPDGFFGPEISGRNASVGIGIELTLDQVVHSRFPDRSAFRTIYGDKIADELVSVVYLGIVYCRAGTAAVVDFVGNRTEQSHSAVIVQRFVETVARDRSVDVEKQGTGPHAAKRLEYM